MGSFNMGPPEGLTLALREHGKLREFVETGTYRGDTTAWAADRFDRVTTIELSPHYHSAAQNRFRDRGHVRVLQGESAPILQSLVPSLAEPALFWLDAHWSGLDTAGREAECPLIEELEAINQSAVAHTILVDDARLFYSPPPKPHRPSDWPDLFTTVSTLRAEGRRHVVLFQDVFVAAPLSMKEALTEWLQDAANETRAGGSAPPWWRRLRL